MGVDALSVVDPLEEYVNAPPTMKEPLPVIVAVPERVRPTAMLITRALTEVYTSEYDRHYAQRGMRQTDGGRCVALQLLTPNADDPRRCTCGIYDLRPRTCRAFTAGSPACLALRKKRMASANPLEKYQVR